MKQKMIYVVLILIFAGILLAAGWKIHQIHSEYQSGETVYEELEQYAPSGPGSNLSSDSSQSGENKTQVDFGTLNSINPDTRAWIRCPGTTINYPVVQSEDNAYYLKHLFDGSYNSAGSIFLDSRNTSDFSDLHNVIYGHHLKNGKMFSELLNYKEQEFYDEHQVMELITPEQNYIMKIFAGYVANVEDDAWKITFSSAEEYALWIENAIERSCFKSEIVPAVTDQIVTLSTCSYEFDNARFVLLGVLKQI